MWKPISEKDLQKKLDVEQALLDEKQSLLWHSIRISPEKWFEASQGKIGGGFWAVALYGQNVVWYNDIEEGFEISPYTSYKHIGQYSANQYELKHVLARLLSA